jgi:uncharacterized protein YqjF (DUF2071 family)
MSKFLTAEWRNLVMANYEVDPKILKPYVPFGTELDCWNDVCYVSLVGFMFLNTKVMGVKIPFHVNFEEVNLRFYVRANRNGEVRRGVVFVKEIVPRTMLALTANVLYSEKYEAMPMKHSWSKSENKNLVIDYQWKKSSWNSIQVEALEEGKPITPLSKEEFITEHYWGYTKINNSKSFEYQVEHPQWLVHPVTNYSILVDFKKVYGDDFAFLVNEKPKSIFLANGSAISVYKPSTIK